MKSVKFRTNLGRNDATNLDIENWQDCVRGAVVEVSNKAAEVLVNRKIAVAVEPEPEEAKPEPKFKAIAKEPAIGPAK